MALVSLRIDVVDQHFDFGRGGPVFHQDPVDDRVRLHGLLRLFPGGLLQVNGEWDVALGALHGRVSVERPDVVMGTLAAKVVAAARPDRIFGRLIAHATHQDIMTGLTGLPTLLENEIWVVGDLAHLHDQPEDIGVVVEHDTAADVGVELPGCVAHDTAGEVLFDLAEKLPMEGNPR